jgi:hypothetical protein
MLPLPEVNAPDKNVLRRTAVVTLVAAAAVVGACAHAVAPAVVPVNPAVHQIASTVKPGEPKEKILKQADLQRLGDSIVSLEAEPDLVLLEKGEILVASDIHYMAIDAYGNTRGRIGGDLTFKVQAGAIRLVAPDSLYAIQTGTSVLTVTPEYLGNSRKNPFPSAKVSVSVK